MPELMFRVRWPDGKEEDCYSPSSVVRDYFEEDRSYPLQTFLVQSERAMSAASDRVRAVHGFPCSRAAAQLEALQRQAGRFSSTPDATVLFLRFQTASAPRNVS
ncbi:MSMEG_0570 family nitrogen starvation response protein [Roseibium sp. HPY-6]|uniref:MSMEG_0570 family nitrogen starvation response protein n=1 Tax=Roseibium sp. HPY-6 TaxID=3229852 RepID=UPI00338F70BA